LARTAVELAAGTDALLDHADARIALATALRAAGRDAEADAEQRHALELWEAKGAAVLIARARRAHPALAAGRSSSITASASDTGDASAPRADGANPSVAVATRDDDAAGAHDAAGARVG